MTPVSKRKVFISEFLFWFQRETGEDGGGERKKGDRQTRL